MIITQTPLRVSFLGGGTDFSDYYHHREGCVLSTAIDKYIYVIVKRRFDKMIRLGYTKTEMVDRVDAIEHGLAREALLLTGINSQIEIGTLADIPSEGSGLGSSSTVTVGLLNALHNYLGNPQTLETLAKQACDIEIRRLKNPAGKQDQYIASYGGLRFIRFLPDESVIVETVNISEANRYRFNQNVMLFFTNRTRRSESILKEQQANIKDRMELLDGLVALAYEGRDCLENGRFEEFGNLLDEGWKLKRKLASKVSDPEIDDLYKRARKAGAFGGKISGAGGGGFLLLFCPPERQDKMRDAMRPLSELPFNIEQDGSKVVFNYRRKN